MSTHFTGNPYIIRRWRNTKDNFVNNVIGFKIVWSGAF